MIESIVNFVTNHHYLKHEGGNSSVIFVLESTLDLSKMDAMPPDVVLLIGDAVKSRCLTASPLLNLASDVLGSRGGQQERDILDGVEILR